MRTTRWLKERAAGRTIREGSGYEGRVTAHVCALAEDGLILTDVFTSREALEEELNEPLLKESGLPEPAEVSIYEVHRTDP